MLTIDNITAQDKYVEALSLGPVASAEKITYVIANAAVYAQLAGQSRDKSIQPWSDEILIAPSTGEFQRVQGMRFRNAAAGKAAQVIAQLIEPDDPVPIGGQPFTSALSPSGTVTPGAQSVQIQHNGALVSTEPALNLIDALGAVFSVTDDLANTRVNVTPAAQMQLISEISNVSGYAFTSIPATFRHLLLTGFIQSAIAPPGTDNVLFRFNNDGVGPYEYTGLSVQNATLFGYGGNGVGFTQPFIQVPSSNSVMGLVVFIPNYALAFPHVAIALSYGLAAAGTDGTLNATGLVWRGASVPINRIDITGNAAVLLASPADKVSLYGIP